VPDTDAIAAARRTIEAWNEGDEDSIRAAFTEEAQALEHAGLDSWPAERD